MPDVSPKDVRPLCAQFCKSPPMVRFFHVQGLWKEGWVGAKGQKLMAQDLVWHTHPPWLFSALLRTSREPPKGNMSPKNHLWAQLAFRERALAAVGSNRLEVVAGLESSTVNNSF